MQRSGSKKARPRAVSKNEVLNKTTKDAGLKDFNTLKHVPDKRAATILAVDCQHDLEEERKSIFGGNSLLGRSASNKNFGSITPKIRNKSKSTLSPSKTQANLHKKKLQLD